MSNITSVYEKEANDRYGIETIPDDMKIASCIIEGNVVELIRAAFIEGCQFANPNQQPVNVSRGKYVSRSVYQHQVEENKHLRFQIRHLTALKQCPRRHSCLMFPSALCSAGKRNGV